MNPLTVIEVAPRNPNVIDDETKDNALAVIGARLREKEECPSTLRESLRREPPVAKERPSLSNPGEPLPGDPPGCQMNVIGQCCCDCIYHVPVNYGCGTEPKPDASLYDKCCCSVKKGFACIVPGAHGIHDNWAEHSCGCELYTSKKRFQLRLSSEPIRRQIPEGEIPAMLAQWDKEDAELRLKESTP